MKGFRDAVPGAMPYADAGKLVTFGIYLVPRSAGNRLWLYRRGDVVPGATDAVARGWRSSLKPGLETAQAYVASGGFWNSGMFLFRGRLEELKKVPPDIPGRL